MFELVNSEMIQCTEIEFVALRVSDENKTLPELCD